MTCSDAALAQRGKAELPGVAGEDHSPGDADLVAGVLVRTEVWIGRADLGQ
jgi:hypothetical protein